MRALVAMMVGVMVAAQPVLADEAVSAEPAPDAVVPEAGAAQVVQPEPVQAEPVQAAQRPAQPEPVPEAEAGSERLWTCETSLSGVKTEVNYLRDDEFRQNVGRIEKHFSGWGRISCPGYVTLREILRRNQMADDGSYCLLWDKQNDTYIGARIGARKGNALCRRTFCERVNGARAAAFQSANAMALAGYDAVTQRPGAAILAAGSGQVVGTLEAAGATAAGVAASPLAVGSLVIGTAAVGGTMWYCAEE